MAQGETVMSGRYGVWMVLGVLACGGEMDRDKDPPPVESDTAGASGVTSAVAGSSGIVSAGANWGGTPLGMGGAPFVAVGGAASVGGAVAASGGSGGEAGAPNPTGCDLLIDDMESGTGRICEGEGRVGVWYAFNDETGTQEPVPTQPGVPILPVQIPEGRAESRFAIHTTGRDFTSWAGGVGIDLALRDSVYGLYDATPYGGVRFWGRSDLASRIQIRVGTESTTSVQYGGTCLFEVADPPYPCNPRLVEIALTPEWTEYQVTFEELGRTACPVAFEPSRLTNIQFFASYTNEFDFWIDDVSFLPAPAPDAACLALPPGCDQGLPVVDPSLEQVLRRNIGKLQGALLPGDFCRLQGLCLESSQIEDLSGMQCLPWLTELQASLNQISDLSALRALVRLEILSLASNQIADLSALAELTRLSNLNLANNQITDIAALGDFRELRELNLSNNRLSDITPLAGLDQLANLNLGVNQVSDVSPLRGLVNLSQLSLYDNLISDLSPLTQPPGFPALSSCIGLHGNPVDCDEQAQNIRWLQENAQGNCTGCPWVP